MSDIRDNACVVSTIRNRNKKNYTHILLYGGYVQFNGEDKWDVCAVNSMCPFLLSIYLC
jgi:hypothetical protein